MVQELLLVLVVVFAVNLMPAFGPPTAALIVFFGFNTDLPLPGLVVVAAVAAASGRYALAHGYRHWGSRLSERLQRNLSAAKAAVESRRRSTILALAVFALSPLPSAQLFGAAGLMGVRLLPFTLAFFAGRLVSYTFYGSSARLAERYSLRETFMEALTSPWGVALQLLLLAVLAVLPQIDWARLLKAKADEDHHRK